MQACCREYGHQIVDVFFTYKFKQIFGLGFGGECFGVQQAVFYVFGCIDIASVESFVQKTAVGYDICCKDDAALFCDADGLAQRLALVFLDRKSVV